MFSSLSSANSHWSVISSKFGINVSAAYCDTAYVTYIDHQYAADTFIPNLDEMTDQWELAEESDENTYFDLEYYFRTYKRK